MVNKALLDFCEQLEATSLSQAMQVHAWLVPAVQSVHILAIAALMGAVAMLNLRVLGLSGADQPLAGVAARFRPVIWSALPVLLLSGAMLIVGEPARSLANWIFQLKMLMVVAVVVLTLALLRPLAANSLHWDARPGAARLLALLTLALWVGIIFAGRWIAYL